MSVTSTTNLSQPNIEEDEQKQYYSEYARLYYSVMILSARMKELQEERSSLEAAQERAKYEKKWGESMPPNSHSRPMNLDHHHGGHSSSYYP